MALYSIKDCCILLSVCWALSLWLGVWLLFWWSETALDIKQSSSLFWGCHSLVSGRICSPVFEIKSLTSVSELWCEVSRTGVLPAGEEPLGISSQELSTARWALCCCLPAILWSYKVHCYCPQLKWGTDPSLIWTMEMQVISPGVLQALGSHSHRQRVVATDLLMSGTRTTTVMLLNLLCEVRHQSGAQPMSACGSWQIQ